MKRRRSLLNNRFRGALSFALALLTLVCLCSCTKDTPEADVVTVTTREPEKTGEPSSTPPETQAPTEQPSQEPTSAPTELPGQIPPITSVSGRYQTYDGTNVMRVDDRAYEICVYLEEEPKLYAELISETAAALKGTTNVYDLIIPTAYGVMMPDDMREKISYYIDLGECIEKTYSHMTGDVRTISCYDLLMRHRDEYIYFRTDHHWTALGAYYAYAAFCGAKGIEPIGPEARESVTFDNFLGTLYRDAGEDPALLPADEIIAYYPVSAEASMLITSSEGGRYTQPIITDVTKYSPVNKYATFAGGDNPITEFTNPNVTDGSVLIIIKESFGNALLPFLVDHYSKIYEIDYRYWKGNVVELAKEVHAADLLFANNFMMISSKSNIGKLSRVVK